MALAAVGTLGSGSSVSSGTTCVLTTSAAAEAGNLVVLIIALDNTLTTDGQTSEVSGIADSSSNTWIKAGEFCNGQAAAGAGATVSVWTCRVSTTIANGGTITATFANSITSKVMSAHEFTMDAGSQIAVLDLTTLAADNAANPGSMLSGTVASGEHLFYRATASEQRSTSAWGATSGYTLTTAAAADTGTVNTSQTVRSEFLIYSATSHTSNPGGTTGTPDQASVFVVFDEKHPKTVSPGLIDQTATIDAPVVSLATAGQTVSPGLIDRTAVLHVPQFNLGISLGFIDQTAVIHDPGVFFDTLHMEFIDQTAVIYDPVVTLGLAGQTVILVAVINQTAILHEPTIISAPQSVVFGLIDQTAVLYDPVVARPGSVNLAMEFIDQTAVVYSFVVLSGVRGPEWQRPDWARYGLLPR